jgi:hypothetical protein
MRSLRGSCACTAWPREPCSRPALPMSELERRQPCIWLSKPFRAAALADERGEVDRPGAGRIVRRSLLGRARHSPSRSSARAALLDQLPRCISDRSIFAHRRSTENLLTPRSEEQPNGYTPSQRRTGGQTANRAGRRPIVALRRDRQRDECGEVENGHSEGHRRSHPATGWEHEAAPLTPLERFRDDTRSVASGPAGRASGMG